MKEVMEKDEVDPFYAGLYGGFYDEENDAVSPLNGHFFYFSCHV